MLTLDDSEEKIDFENLTREEGDKLWDLGYALIDTSGRTRSIQDNSCIAIASKYCEHTVMYKSAVKKKVAGNLDKKLSKESRIAFMHSVGLAECLLKHLGDHPGVFICSDGHKIGRLKHYLKMIMGDQYDDNKIMIRRSLKLPFGKRNPADRLAWSTVRNRNKPSQVLNDMHFRQFLVEKESDSAEE